MLVDMVHDNHGEPAFKTRFRNAALMKSYGYDGVVIPDALAAAPGARRGVVSNGAGPNAATQLHAAIDERVQEALSCGLQVYFYSDALMLPAPVVRANPELYQCSDHTGHLCPARPAVYEAMGRLVTELFRQWPEAAGLIMRTSEAYPESLPHMTGNPLQTPSCPACRGLSLTQRTAQFITAMHRAVVERAGKVYIHRTWQNVGGPSIHDNPALYRELLEHIPDDPRLLFSFKFTQGDFWHGRPWNPCITADHRPKWVEFPSAREFEGKGAFPNFQAPIWTGQLNGAGSGIHSLADIPPENLGGIWGISRGAGWGGPYLQREEWLDVNVYALGRLARQPGVSAAEIARDWTAQAFGVAPEHEAVKIISDMLLMSTGVAGALLYVPAQADQRRRGIMLEPALHDDLLDVERLWYSARTVAAGPAAEQACQEKLSAAAGAAAMRRLFDSAVPGLPNKSQARDLLSTLVYYESFAGTLAHMFCGFVRYAQWQAGQSEDGALARQAEHHLQHAQAAWQHHSQRHAMLPGAPSVFNETSLWERTNECLESVA